MKTASQVTYCKVTEQRGVKRLWLQGMRLKACGFDKGARYRVDFEADKGLLHLVLDAGGPRVVSGRKQGDSYSPIVDICNADVVRLVGESIRVRAVLSVGRITFSISHLDTKRREREARFRGELEQGRITEGTVCAGAGYATEALHEGLKQGGIDGSVSWIIDRESRYLAVADKNCRAVTDDTVLFEASLEELECDLLSPVSIVQAALPCTGHSKAGKTKNKIKLAEAHKTDNTAVLGLVDVIRATQPSLVVSENVREARDSGSYLLLKSMLKHLGYIVHEVDLGPEHTGSMEVRRRYWFIAVSEGLDQVDLTTLPYFEKTYDRVGELLDAVADDDPSWSENQYLKDKQKRDAAAGKGFANRPLLTAFSQSIATAPRTYQKRQSTSPMLVRGDGMERLFTPAELCRAHSAPDYMIDGLSDAVAYEALGQSIDYRQGLAMGLVIARDCCGGSVRDGYTEAPAQVNVEEPKVEAVNEPNERQMGLFAEGK